MERSETGIMNFTGKEVLHIKYGTGTIIRQEDRHLSVEFRDAGRVSKFLYPDCLEGFLTFTQEDLQLNGLQELEKRKSLLEKEKEDKQKRYKEMEKAFRTRRREALQRRKKTTPAKKKGCA